MSLIPIEFRDTNGMPRSCQISGKPDTCLICGHKVDPIFCYALGDYQGLGGSLEIVFRCPSENCRHLFVAYYDKTRSSTNYFVLSGSSLPLRVERRQFSNTIQKISKQFTVIYNQAMLAEKNGLDQISGCGYRKSIEFLIKDYLISLDSAKEDQIKKLWLGNAIEKIDNKNIRICAERATWIGNDETHYVKVWEDKDIENLKDLIDLVVMWIDSEEKTKKYEKEMPKNQ